FLMRLTTTFICLASKRYNTFLSAHARMVSQRDRPGGSSSGISTTTGTPLPRGSSRFSPSLCQPLEEWLHSVDGPARPARDNVHLIPRSQALRLERRHAQGGAQGRDNSVRHSHLSPGLRHSVLLQPQAVQVPRPGVAGGRGFCGAY